MTNSGVSKKLCVASIGIFAIIDMGKDAEDKLPYAIIAGVVIIAYLVKQTILDWRSNGKEESKEENGGQEDGQA